MNKEKKIIISISSCICMLDIFYELFFNIYILQTATTNIALIFACYMIGILISVFLYYPFFKILNGKTAMWIYRFSFVLSFVVVLLSMTVHAHFAFALIFITSLKYVFNMCFYIPQEIAMMKHVEKNTSESFLAVKSVFNTSSRVLFSLIVSSLFVYVETIWLFAIMLVDVSIMFVLSFWSKPAGVDFNFRPKGFWKETKQYPHMKYIYASHTLKRASEAGVVPTIIPMILFLNMGGEFSLGIYSSIACIITACWLPLFSKLKKHHKPILITSIVSLILSALLLVVSTNPITYVAFFLINQFTSTSYTNVENASLFDSIKYSVLYTNKEEHCFYYGIFGKTAEAISYGIGILFYLIMPLEYSLACILLFFMLMKLLSYFLWQKSERLAKKFEKQQVIQI